LFFFQEEQLLEEPDRNSRCLAGFRLPRASVETAVCHKNVANGGEVERSEYTP